MCKDENEGRKELRGGWGVQASWLVVVCGNASVGGVNISLLLSTRADNELATTYDGFCAMFSYVDEPVMTWCELPALTYAATD